MPIDWMVAEKGLTAEDAFMLCSMAGDLAITQVVDRVKGVHMMMPKALFTKSRLERAVLAVRTDLTSAE